jgi:uncharacterized protein YacL (UPF0231 family)
MEFHSIDNLMEAIVAENNQVTTNQTPPKPVVMKLDDDRDAYVVPDPKYIIHRNELEQLRGILEESVISAEGYENIYSEFKRKHDTITLTGVRGSGKTTFMLSFLNFIKKNIDGAEDVSFKFHGKDKIEVLEIFDPTLIENKTHIFMNIVSMIKDKVDHKAKLSNCFNNENGESSRDYREWEKSFRKLAEGLPSLDGVGTNGFNTDAWLDAEFVMGKGVRMAHAANNLEKTFHTFVRNSLKFIGKKAFILCFDDIDTNFAKGLPVLEVLHKYLTTPQLITILSGDTSLYLTLIRDHQWNNFSERFLALETRNENDLKRYKGTVAQLEKQFFLKLLKPEHRISLDSLYRREQHDSNSFIVVRGDKLNFRLRICYSKMMGKFGVFSGGQHYTYYRFLASSPLRMQKQLLCAFDSFLSGKSTDLENKIIEIFWSDLAEQKVDVSNLRNVPHYIIPQIIDYLINNNLLIEGYTLTPIFSEDSIPLCQNSCRFPSEFLC